MPKNKTCPAFFLDATIDSAGNYSPCTALGGGTFKTNDESFAITWQSSILEDARQQSINNVTQTMCQRCWKEEEIGFKSERQYLIDDLPDGLDYSDSAYYMSGPRHLNIKVSNICNLRCRTCQGADSYLYHIEGAYYEKTHNLVNTPYTIDNMKKRFTDTQLDALFEFSNNLERIELYGGEPFLDSQIPKYLLRLIDAGMSTQIDLTVSTNATHALTEIWETILTNFREVIINVSIDGIHEKFTYLRHPGNWATADVNIRSFVELSRNNDNISVMPVITVSALNVYNIDEVFEYFVRYDVEPFIILVQWPQYYCVNVLPETIKDIVNSKLTSANNSKYTSIISLMYTEPTNYQPTRLLSPWEEFKFWTKEKDAYRNESFIDTFTDIGNHIIAANEW